jgi:hypothetical protein
MKAKTRNQIFAKSGGKCIYCGGCEPATTIDHMPPIVLFQAKDRPRGLEFPSCEACNNGAGHSDLVAAMFGRAFSNVQPSEVDEVRRIFEAVRNNIPGLLEEMYVDPASQALAASRIGVNPGDNRFIAMDGPISMSYLRAFGARLAFAMYFNETGRIVPNNGGALARIYSNLDLFQDTVPQEIFDILPDPSTLAAGKKHVGSQFKISTRAADGGGMTITFASFRLSFAIMAAAADELTKLQDPELPPAAEPLVPGYLKGM